MSNPWKRPADWLPLPPIFSGQQAIAGLIAVTNNDGNFVALTVSGNYTVDWGDGTIDTVAAGVVASHQYNYATLSSPVASEGYKMAIVQIAPQAGQNLTSVNFTTRHPTVTGTGKYTVNWLDLTICGSHISTLIVGTTSNVACPFWLEQCTIIDHALTSMSLLFQSCSSLQSVPLFNTAAVTSWRSAFNGCSSLKYLPLFDTSSVTDLNTCFAGCVSLQTVPLFNTGLVVEFQGAFQGCTSLVTVPFFNTALAKDMHSTFQGCASLKSVPAFNMASMSDPLGLSSMFTQCLSLEEVPAFDVSAVVSLSNLVQLTNSIRSVKMTNIKNSLNLSGQMLSSAALNAIYNNLATVAGQTITITGNYGAAGSNTAIATGKGWVVVP